MDYGLTEAIIISLPQTMASILFSLILLGENIVEKKKQLWAATFLYSFASLIIRTQLENFTLQVTFSYLSAFLVLWLSFRMSFLKTFSLLTLIYLESVILEGLYFQPVLWLTGLTYEQLVSIKVRLYFHATLYNLILFAIAYGTYKSKFRLKNLESVFHPIKRNKILISLIIMIAIIATLIGFIEASLIGSAPYTNQEDLHVTVLLLIFALIISIYLVKKMLNYAHQYNANLAQEAYIENINELVTSIRSQRHDFLNHLQTIYGLGQFKKYDELNHYVSHLIGEVRQIDTVISVKIPALAALLHSKLAKAAVQEIQLDLQVDSSLEGCRIKAFELVKIFGNLIDNAIDAVNQLPQQERWIKVNIQQDEANFLIQVANGGKPIQGEYTKKIFESGFTTKGTTNHSGIGLPTVRQLIQNYNGTITLDPDADHPKFNILLPN